MAFAFTVDETIPLAGSAKGLLLCRGSVTNAGGATGGALGFDTQGIVKILYYGFTNNTSSAAFKVVKSYDGTTFESDILTLTCGASDGFDYFVVGEDAGDAA